MDMIYIIDKKTEALIYITKEVAAELKLKPYQRVSRKIVLRAVGMTASAIAVKADSKNQAKPSSGN